MGIDKEKLIAAIRAETPGNLYAHAVRELPDAGDEDEMQAYMNECLLQMVLVFSSQGHSGFSAGYAISALTKLLNFEPLRPLTGEDSEWNKVSDDLWQNKRCSRVFKTSERAYDIDGIVFREPSGACYTSGASRTTVTFPYTPQTQHVDVDADGKEIAA